MGSWIDTFDSADVTLASGYAGCAFKGMGLPAVFNLSITAIPFCPVTGFIITTNFVAHMIVRGYANGNVRYFLSSGFISKVFVAPAAEPVFDITCIYTSCILSIVMGHVMTKSRSSIYFPYIHNSIPMKIIPARCADVVCFNTFLRAGCLLFRNVNLRSFFYTDCAVFLFLLRIRHPRQHTQAHNQTHEQREPALAEFFPVLRQ